MSQSWRGRALALAGVLVFLLGGRAQAHRVNVFAYVEGNTVHVECSYSRSNRVRFGEIEVRNAATSEVYLKGTTDETGNFVFPVPDAAKAAKADLSILLKAGEGHQNDWIVKADEHLVSSATPPPPGSAAPNASGTAATNPATSAASDSASATVAGKNAPATTTVDAAALERIVESAVEKKIAPVRNILLAEKERGPGMTEIFGGIGYLVGIAGLLAYARSRRGGHGS